MQKIERVYPKGVPAAIGPYCPVTIMGSTVFVSGQIPLNPENGQIQSQDIEGQAHQVMKNLKAALEGAGCSFKDVAKTSILLTDMANFAKVNAVYAEYFENNQFPARVCYAVKQLPRDSLVEIDAIAYKPASKL